MHKIKNIHVWYERIGTSPYIFMNVDLSETVRVEVEGTTTLLFIPQIVTTNKTGNHISHQNVNCIHITAVTTTTAVFFAMGGLQVVGAGEIAVQLEASKNATYRCRLNDGEFVDCKHYWYIDAFMYHIM